MHYKEEAIMSNCQGAVSPEEWNTKGKFTKIALYVLQYGYAVWLKESVWPKRCQTVKKSNT